MEITKPTERVILPATRRQSLALNWSWQSTALSLVLLLAAGLRLIGLDKNGYSNGYYAAAVKSMLTSWHNFFFISFDSAGFVSVDKPPLALWIQTISAKLLGFSGFSLLLPEVLAGIGAVALLYHLVRRTFSPLAGLIAALVLALTPVSVAVDRNNTVDSILVFFMLLAAWAFFKATESERLGWLITGGVLIGLGFNVKMVEAFMVLPTFYLVYLLATRPQQWIKRGLQLTVATVVILVVSFSWATIVDLTPASQRPYVGSSSTNSVYNLIFGYNGLGRQTGTSGVAGSASTMLAKLPPSMREELEANMTGLPGQTTSEPGALRLFQQDLAGQVSWLLPMALLSALALAWRGRWRLPLDRKQQSLLVWLGWLLTCGLVFSFNGGIFHPYYLVMLAPPIAALVGAGLTTMWEDWRAKNWRGWLLPLAVLVTLLYGAYIASSYGDWDGWLLPLIIGTGILTLVSLIGFRLLGERLKGGNGNTLARVAIGLVIAAMLVGPTVWALTPVVAEGNGTLPEATPQLLKGQSQNFDMIGGNYDVDKLVQYLEANRGGAKYLVATVNATSAESIALKSNEPAVMAMGGFLGSDPILTADKLTQLIKEGQVRYFLLQSMDGMPGSGGSFPASGGSGSETPGQVTPPLGGLSMGNLQQLTELVQKQCKVVDAGQWGGPTQSPTTTANTGGSPFGGIGGGQKLYDCAGSK